MFSFFTLHPTFFGSSIETNTAKNKHVNVVLWVNQSWGAEVHQLMWLSLSSHHTLQQLIKVNVHTHKMCLLS